MSEISLDLLSYQIETHPPTAEAWYLEYLRMLPILYKGMSELQKGMSFTSTVSANFPDEGKGVGKSGGPSMSLVLVSCASRGPPSVYSEESLSESMYQMHKIESKIEDLLVGGIL